ncbi:hypothetical protein [Spiroplasma endosymbiont of Aspidapion aeneum]|uniref:hypothetical protein n=1 Tax=Spiroplasma endosymbiont of Aspidapion aeneum TaxID=3066276 RepID=UPI00313E5AED
MKNNLFDESFYNNLGKKSYIYKLYFKGLSDYFYLGISHQNKHLLKKIRKELWVSYCGLTFNEGNSNDMYVPIEKYIKMSIQEKERFDNLIFANRQRMFEGFAKNYFDPKQTKYIKILHFMQINSLSITDLRFEIVFNNSNLPLFKLKKIYYNMIADNKLWSKGFNTFSIIEKVFYDQEINGQFSRKFFEKFEEILNWKIEEKNVYQSWNIFWNYFQVFLYSFKGQTINWLIYWDVISIEKIEEYNKQITDLIFSKYLSYNFSYKPLLIRQLTFVNNLVNKKNEDEDEEFNNKYFKFLTNYKLKKISHKNQKLKAKITTLNFNTDVSKQDFQDNQLKWIISNYKNWEAKYSNISKLLNDYKNMVNLFNSNPFVNTLYITEILKEVEKYQYHFIKKYDYNFEEKVDTFLVDLYLNKELEDKKYDLIYNLYLRDIHNIYLLLLSFICHPKFKDFVLIGKFFNI